METTVRATRQDSVFKDRASGPQLVSKVCLYYLLLLLMLLFHRGYAVCISRIKEFLVVIILSVFAFNIFRLISNFIYCFSGLMFAS